MKGSAARSSRTKKPEEGDAKPTSKVSRSTASKPSGTTSKTSSSRSKTETGAKKTTTKRPTPKSTLGGTDNANVPSYMRPTRASMASHNATGSIGDGDPPKKRGTTKPSTLSKTKPGTKPTTRPKRTKPVTKPKEQKGQLEPSIEAPVPAEISTEQGADAFVNVGLAPTTPQTPGHDPVPQASDNESTGGLMETIDETPLNACNVKHWMLFSDATHGDEGNIGHSQALKSSEEATLQLKDDERTEETEEVEATEVDEGSQLMTKKADLHPTENLVTTETVMDTNDSEGEVEDQGVDRNEDQSATEASLTQAEDPPVTGECNEVLETEEASESVAPGAEVDPGTEAAIPVQQTTQEQQTSSLAVPQPEEKSLSDPQQEEAGESSNNTRQTTTEEDVPATKKDAEVGTDPQEKASQPSIDVKEDITNKPQEEVTETGKQTENPVSLAPSEAEQKESTSEGSTSAQKTTPNEGEGSN